MRDEIVAGIKAALPVDGVLLGLHGAMALEHDDDGEGLLLQAVRSRRFRAR
jgi:microcystin degradation protein MlrC